MGINYVLCFQKGVGICNAPANVALLSSQILFLGPLIQLSMDYPWDMVDGLRVAFGKNLRRGFALIKKRERNISLRGR